MPVQALARVRDDPHRRTMQHDAVDDVDECPEQRHCDQQAHDQRQDAPIVLPGHIVDQASHQKWRGHADQRQHTGQNRGDDQWPPVRPQECKQLTKSSHLGTTIRIHSEKKSLEATYGLI